MGLPLLVGIWFQVLLTPLKRVLFTFQSPYWSTIGYRVVLSLGGWSPQLHTEFHELRATLGHLSTESNGRRIQDCHLLWSAFPDCSASHAFVTPRGPATPSTSFCPKTRQQAVGPSNKNWCWVWARSAFARRYLRSLG